MAEFSDLLTLAMIWSPILLALIVAGMFAGFAIGAFGIGGGFVVVPAMVVLLPLLGGTKHDDMHLAIGTSFATIVAMALRSTLAYARTGAVDLRTVMTWAPWLVGGVGIGVWQAQHIVERTLIFVFAGGIVLMSALFLVPRLSHLRVRDTMPTGLARIVVAGGVGLFSAPLGIGGGPIAVIVMKMCGRTLHEAVATAAGLGLLIALPGTIGWILIGLDKPGLPIGSLGYVYVPGAVIITLLSILTAPLGVAAADALPPQPLKRAFGAYLLFIAGVMTNRALHM